MRRETFKTEIETRQNGLETKSQDFITANNPTKLSNQKSCLLTYKSCHLFMVRQFFMVVLMLDMHGTSNNSNEILPNINLM